MIIDQTKQTRNHLRRRRSDQCLTWLDPPQHPCFLPINDAIKTGVLSKRWASLLTSLPSLSFDSDCFVYLEDFTSAVDDTLLLHRTFVLDVREWGGVEQMRLQMKMTQKEEAKLVLSLGFCMMRFGEILLCGFFFGFWVFSQTNGAKAQTLTNGVWLLKRSDLNSRLSPCHIEIGFQAFDNKSFKYW